MKEYNKNIIPLAKELRKNMTPWERKLWYVFLRKYPIRFQRQKTIGNYIADFYCAKAKLVIELAGGCHYKDEKIMYDKERTEILEKYDLRIMWGYRVVTVVAQAQLKCSGGSSPKVSCSA